MSSPSGFGACRELLHSRSRTNNICAAGWRRAADTPAGSDHTTANSSVIGGTFLPSGWGANSGKFLVACLRYKLLVFDAAGNGELFDPIGPSYFANPLIAPTQFEPYGGHLFVTDELGYVWRADPAAGGLTIFADFPNFQSGPFGALFWFGIEFTPADWGAFGKRMLVSDAFASVDNGPGTRASHVAAVAADGTAILFATVPLKEGENGAPGQDG
jgi:hypothetical protein